MGYQPGKHIIASLSVHEGDRIRSCSALRQTIDQLIERHGLHKLGEVYHDFEPAGFTAVVCLSESHISIHTWPEHELVNLDIYLSNFLRNNDGTVQDIYASLISFFNGAVSSEQIINR